MALSATVDLELRTTGFDGNGGGYNTAAGGTDWSQQDAAQVFIDGATITGVVQATTTDILIVGYTVLAGDIGNIFQDTAGTAAQGFYQIVSVNTGTNTWTMDRAVGTAAQTCVGRMGGGLATIGKVGSVPIVAGNRIWIKYHISNVYITTSTTSNVVNGRLTIAAGSQNVQVLVRGYDVTHGDQTGNRPTLRWGVAGGSNYLISLSNTGAVVENVIFDGNRANFTGTRGLLFSSGFQYAVNCKFMGCNSVAIGGNSAISDMCVFFCEFADNATSQCISHSGGGMLVCYGCYFHDSSVAGIVNSSAGYTIVTRCIFDTLTIPIQITSTGRLIMHECDIYTMSSQGVDLQNASNEAMITNCRFESVTNYAINTSAAGVYGAVKLYGNAFYNNTNTYDTAKVLPQNTFGSIIQSAGSFFVDAPNQNFQANAIAGRGALVRAMAMPTTYPGGTANYQDVGAQQHQDTGGGGGSVIRSLIVTRELPTSL